MAAAPKSMKPTVRRGLVAASILGAAGALGGFVHSLLRMPGCSHTGALPEVTQDQRDLAVALRRDVEQLGSEIGERNHVRYAELGEAAKYLERRFAEMGLHPRRQSFEAGSQEFANLEVEVTGSERAHEIVVVGAHYDSVVGSPGANDNGSGVAALLALAARFADAKPQRTLRFVAFVNEEPPHFQTDAMGSLVYARRCRERDEDIVGMISLETIGWFSDEPGSQSYPPPLSALYPSEGNFVAFVANLGSRQLVRDLAGSFRRHAQFPSEGAALPSITPGVGWSDQWAFWKMGYPGLMVTDTAPFRYPHYHTRQDRPEHVDYERLARVVTGLDSALRDLVGGCPVVMGGRYPGRPAAVDIRNLEAGAKWGRMRRGGRQG